MRGKERALRSSTRPAPADRGEDVVAQRGPGGGVRTRRAPLPWVETTDRPLPEPVPLYHVVLLDDDEHTYDYVIRMLSALFGHTIHEAFAMAREVDTTGRVVVSTTHRERAELKREQIEMYGPDPLIPYSRGSMRAVIEPIA